MSLLIVIRSASLKNYPVLSIYFLYCAIKTIPTRKVMSKALLFYKIYLDNALILTIYFRYQTNKLGEEL